LREVEIPTPADDGLVPIELAALTSGVEVTRAAGIDPSYTTISSATIIVFHATEDRVLQNRYLADVTTDKVYLKKGETETSYRVFAVANLVDANCPNGNASTYFADVDEIADLEGKYFIASPAGTAPALMPMTSIGSAADLSTQIATVVVQPPSLIAPVPPAVEYSVTIQMRSIYTKVEMNIYNKSGSGVTPQSYFIENLPKHSWIVERAKSSSAAAGDDYPQSYTGYDNTAWDDLTTGWTASENSYMKRTITFYTLENRRGVVSGLNPNMYERKAEAPANALEFTFTGQANGKILYTYVLIGKGRDALDPPDEWYGNYDVDRNCIYQVNVYIDGANETNITSDTRREYLNVVAVCGELTPAGKGTEGEF
jgi:hypothetical protein